MHLWIYSYDQWVKRLVCVKSMTDVVISTTLNMITRYAGLCQLGQVLSFAFGPCFWTYATSSPPLLSTTICTGHTDMKPILIWERRLRQIKLDTVDQCLVESEKLPKLYRRSEEKTGGWMILQILRSPSLCVFVKSDVCVPYTPVISRWLTD